MAYYHTYRPQQFNQLIGQEPIVQILQAALKADRLAQAYVFVGTRGTGKTTTARLLAKVINCSQLVQTKNGWQEPCNQCDLCQSITAGHCLDVIEVDAASNRGIEEIRQLQEQGRFTPQQAKKKIIIIDEAHMLTKEAFNALLKTLEEPPDHLIFIMATTEAHKLPLTVLSRCQRYDFVSPSAEVISHYLERIVTGERLKAEPEALRLIADLAHGSFRDSATLLEQASHQSQPLTEQAIIDLLGLPAQELVERYLKALDGRPDTLLMTDLESYFQRGGNPHALLDTLFQVLAQAVARRASLVQPATVLASLVKLKYQVKQSPLATIPLLVAIAEPNPAGPDFERSTIQASPLPTKTAKTLPMNDLAEGISAKAGASQTVAVAARSAVEKLIAKPVPKMVQTVKVDVAQQVPPAILPEGELSKSWQKVIEQLAEQNQSSLVAILRTARPLDWQSPVFRIGVQFRFHADQLTRQRNRDILEAALSDILAVSVRIEPTIEPTADLIAAAEELAL